MDQKRMQEIFSDEAFVKGLLALETPAEVQAAMKEKGLDLSESEIMQIGEQINRRIENGTGSDELSIDQLDDVAGGLGPLVLIPLWLSLSAAVGMGVGGLSKLRW